MNGHYSHQCEYKSQGTGNNSDLIKLTIDCQNGQKHYILWPCIKLFFSDDFFVFVSDKANESRHFWLRVWAFLRKLLYSDIIQRVCLCEVFLVIKKLEMEKQINYSYVVCVVSVLCLCNAIKFVVQKTISV